MAGDVETAERDEQILALRRRCWSYRRIASALGISKNTALRVVHAYLAEIASETKCNAELLRSAEIDRIDSCIAAVWDQVEQGHLGAVDRVVRLGERRAKLLGLDMPTKIAPTTPEGDEPYRAPAADLSKLSVEELRQLRGLRAKIDNDTDDGAGASG